MNEHIHAFHDVLAELANKEDLSLVQIGAHVGKTENDPLYEFLKSKHPPPKIALLVEPIKDYFDQLVENYKGVPGLAFEQSAVCSSNDHVRMWRIDCDPHDHGKPYWLAQLSSLLEERHTTVWIEGEFKRFYLEHRTTEIVQGIRFMDLMEKHGIDSIDLLQIDVEGYDFELLRLIDFEKIKPTFINYERVLLGEMESYAEEMLSRHGYRFIKHGQDTLAIMM